MKQSEIANMTDAELQEKLKLFFWKKPYDFFEILVLLCYVMGVGMLIYTLFGLIQVLLALSVLKMAGILGFVYHT